jgi:hypothetical protein
VSRPGVAVALEPVGRHRRLVVGRRERGERDHPPFADAARLGLVGEDVEEPRLEAGALLEAVEPSMTASHVSWTTSSATASVETYARATRLRLA